MTWLERFDALERERARVLDKLNEASWQNRVYELLNRAERIRCRQSCSSITASNA